MTKNVNYEQKVVLLNEPKNSLREAKPNLQENCACPSVIG